MAGKIALVVEDLLFLSKILETARDLNIQVVAADPVAIEECLTHEFPCAIILDLNHRSGQALPLLAFIRKLDGAGKIQVMGFLSHVQSDLAKAARDAGCARVLARSVFAKRLPQILQELAS